MRRVALTALFVLLFTTRAFAACSLTNVSGLSFSYDPLGTANATATGTLYVTCDTASASNVVLSLDAGLHSGGATSPWRKMQGPNGMLLAYNLYTDPAMSLIWGDGTSGTSVLSEPQTAGNFSYTMYGFVPTGQNVAAGSYSDTVTLTMTY